MQRPRLSDILPSLQQLLTTEKDPRLRLAEAEAVAEVADVAEVAEVVEAAAAAERSTMPWCNLYVVCCFVICVMGYGCIGSLLYFI
jgi:hypothetical protein